MTAHSQQQQDLSNLSMRQSQHNGASNKRSPGPATPPQTHKKSCQGKRSVSFSPSVRCRKTLSIINYTNQEVEATWYSPSDFQSMKAEVRDTVKRMESNKTIDDVEYCRRGVERHTKHGSQLRRENRQKALWAVMEEQDTYDAETTDDEIANRIAHSYHVAGARTRRMAHVMGLADEQNAQEVATETTTKRTARALRRAFSLAA